MGPHRPDSPSNAPLALRWVAHLPEAVNLNLVGFETAATVRAAVELAPTCGIPVMNLVVGDRHGNIAWTLCGRLPRRDGYDGRIPISSTNALAHWRGLLPAPPTRASSTPQTGASGPPTTASPARRNTSPPAPGTLPLAPAPGKFATISAPPVCCACRFPAHQLDDRALFLERWQKLLLTTLDSDAARPHTNLARIRPTVANWAGVPPQNRPVIPLSSDSVPKSCPESSNARCSLSDCRPFFPRPHSALPRSRTAGLDHSRAAPTTLARSQVPHLPGLARGRCHRCLPTPQRSRATPAAPLWGAINRVHIQHPLSRACPGSVAGLTCRHSSCPEATTCPACRATHLAPRNGWPSPRAANRRGTSTSQAGSPAIPFRPTTAPATKPGPREPAPLPPGPPSITSSAGRNRSVNAPSIEECVGLCY